MTYTSLNIKVGVDARTPTEIDRVAMNDWPTLPPLNIDTGCITRNDLVVLDEDLVLRPGLNHDAATFEVLKLA